jgi:hypothetical protein
MTRGDTDGDVMSALVVIAALVATALLIPTVAVGLFRLAELKRPEDAPPPPVDEWAASHELQTPE